MKFDKNYWIGQLKAEIGLSDIPYDKLDEYYVDFNTVFGENQDATNLINRKNAKDYIDQQLLVIEEQYKGFENELELYNNELNSPKLDTTNIALLNEDVKPVDYLVEFLEVELPTSDGNVTYLVGINKKEQSSSDQSAHVKASAFFKGVRDSKYFTGFERCITYYDFYNLASRIVQQQNNDVLSYDKIQDRLSTIFENSDVDHNILKKL